MALGALTRYKIFSVLTEIRIRHFAMICVAALSLQLTACGYFIYQSEEIEGWVVDTETGKPIEGVVVVADWTLKGGFTNAPTQVLKINEAVTDVNGRYYIPAWGPKFRLTGRLPREAPGVWMFKTGYQLKGLSNANLDGSTFYYHKKTIKLDRFQGAPTELAESLRYLSDTLTDVGFLYDSLCPWQHFPQMLIALDNQERKFRETNTRHPGLLASKMKSQEERLKAAGCSVTTFLEKR